MKAAKPLTVKLPPLDSAQCLKDLVTKQHDPLALTQYVNEHLTEIFAHQESPIVDHLEKVNVSALQLLREGLFDNLKSLLTEYSERELIARKKANLIAHDIFVIGFSVVSKQEDKRLRKICRNKTHGNDEINSVQLSCDADEPPDEDLATLILTCAQLKGTIDSLTATVHDMRVRINDLENEVTILKLKDHNQSTDEVTDAPATDNDSSSTSSDTRNATEDTPETTLTTARSLSPSFAQVVACTHREAGTPADESGNTPAYTADAPNATASPDISVPNGILRSATSDNTIYTSPAVGFRMTRAQRRNFTKNANGRDHNKLTANRFEVLGTAEGDLPLRAARPNRPTQQQPYRVYIGNLLAGSSTNALREYMVSIGIDGDSILDVLELKTKASNKAAFCVSVCNACSYNDMFDATKWPSGVIIRPFRPPTYHKTNPLREKQNRYNRNSHSNHTSSQTYSQSTRHGRGYRHAHPPNTRNYFSSRNSPGQSHAGTDETYYRGTSRSHSGYDRYHQHWSKYRR